MSYLRPIYSKSLSTAGKFVPVTGFVPNPGDLAGCVYLPENRQAGAPLVVVLHGCTQNGVDYAKAAGWVELADRNGFALLIPQQLRSNNANLCFNWFERGDTKRGMGEAASIKAMIDDVVGSYALDANNIFITGLSAGAAMAGTMLACYPETFAAGGLISGLPHGVSDSMPTAFRLMRQGPDASGAKLAANVTAATDYSGQWPRVSVWHGNADRTVNALNGEATVAQWLAVHDLPEERAHVHRFADVCHRTWSDAEGEIQVEHIAIRNMGHGTPIDPHGVDAVGNVAPYILDAGVASSKHLTDFWGIGEDRNYSKAENAMDIDERPVNAPASYYREARETSLPHQFNDKGIGKIINDALRAAGLMR